MKYFFDAEFHERIKKPWFSKKYHLMELISIGIVDEDGRTYYAISSEFDLKAAWNNEWLRENVLYSIYRELRDIQNENTSERLLYGHLWTRFSYKSLKRLISWHGKKNDQIAAEIFDFVNPDLGFHIEGYSNSEFRDPMSKTSLHFDKHNVTDINEHFYAQPEFYAYFADYDWVLLCSLFGSMMQLPPGFPMYCKDIKQMLHEYAERLSIYMPTRYSSGDKDDTPEIKYAHLTSCKAYENLKNNNEHSALADAIWNKKVYDYLQTRKFE